MHHVRPIAAVAQLFTCLERTQTRLPACADPPGLSRLWWQTTMCEIVMRAGALADAFGGVLASAMHRRSAAVAPCASAADFWEPPQPETKMATIANLVSVLEMALGGMSIRLNISTNLKIRHPRRYRIERNYTAENARQPLKRLVHSPASRASWLLNRDGKCALSQR